MQHSIRPISPTEIEEFLDFCALLSEFDGSAEFDRERMRATAQHLLNDSRLGHAVWLLHEGKRAGYLVLSYGWSFEFGGKTAVLEHLFVCEEFRRLGLAHAAIEWAENKCREEGAGVVYLGVDATNERAQNLYSKREFLNSSLLFWVKFL